VVIFSLAESGIRRPEDLVGKRIMSFPTSYVIPTVLARIGLGPEDVEIGPPSFDLSELYSGAYDAWSGYYTNEVLLARAEGHEVHVIYPTDYGVHLYGDVLVTRRELVEKDPNLVRRVVRTLVGGWEWVLKHVEEAAALVLQWSPALRVEHQRVVLEASLPFVHAGEQGLGGMTDERWASMAAMMKEFGLLPEEFDPRQAYVLGFSSPRGMQTP
jgi:NitT/TauT family transport system substrate-binding protein